MTNYYISPKDSMLLVIDIQEKLLKAMKDDEKEKIIRNSIILSKTAKELTMPIIASEQYKKGLGETIASVSDAIGDAPILEKMHFDCCKDDSINSSLSSLNKNTVVICGIESHVCVLQTALNLMNQGKNVVIAYDAVASRRKADWQTAMDTLREAGAVIYPTESIVFMLLEVAGTPQFKAIAPLIK